MHRGLLQLARLAGVAGGLAASLAMAQQAAGPEIIAAPAFSAQQLSASPVDNWITNGGSLSNQRYSPLTQINRDNVAGLRALWRTGMGSGTNFGNAGQAQILEYDGTLFVSNGANDVFAIAVESGQILWTYHGNPDPKSGTPMGRSNRGVALGDGMVFVGQLNAKLVALDQRTGKVVWSVQVEPWQNGFSITAAPLYYDGMVIQGLSGGEMGIRGRVKAYYEIENLESAYGYYLDKNLWNDLANLFSVDGSMELAQRGAYDGREHVRAFLLKVFGRGSEGPVANRLGNHMQLQPVIDVAPDGKSAKIRIRMFQQMSFGPRASVGAAVYENTAVLEDGKWKLRDDHTYNTLAANYDGGWVRAASPTTPGQDKQLPPDRPPSLKFEMFPVVYDIPFHNANPVTGSTAVPAIVDASGHPPGMPDAIASTIREIGPKVEAARTGKLYEPLQQREPYTDAVVTRDVAYGPAPRNTADIFIPLQRGPRKPVVVFLYGGGFAGGSKHQPGSPFYDNIGRWAAAHNLVGVTANYRLAPQSQWPAGVEDVTALVKYLRAHIAEYGGDPRRIFLWGHSSGGAHVADYLAHAARGHQDPQVAGAILMSAAVYDLGHEVSIWKAYYGDDVSQYPKRSALPGLVLSRTPLLVTDAELDPPNFQAQAEELAAARSKAGHPVQRLHVPGHSHLSEAYAIGTADDSVTGPVLKFIRAHSGQAVE